MKRWQTIVLGVVISAVTLAYALNGNDLSKIGGELARGQYFWVIPCLALTAVGLALRAMRWRFLLNNRLSALHSFHITNVSYFFNAWLPFRLGEVARAYLATRLKPPIALLTALSSVVVERLTDLLAVVVLTALAIVISPLPVNAEIRTGAQVSGLIAVAGMAVLSIFAARRGLAHALLNVVVRILPFLEKLRIRNLADHVLDGIAPLGKLRGVAGALFWTAVAWAASVVAGFVLLYVFYDQPTWTAALLLITIASIAIALPAVPGSIGPFEAAVILGLQMGGLIDPANGLPQERALAFAVLLHILNVFSYASLGYLGLLQERVTLREVFQGARQLAARKPQPESEPTQL